MYLTRLSGSFNKMKTLVVLVLDMFPLLIILLSPFCIRDKTEWPLNCQRGYFRDIMDSGLAHKSGNCCPAKPRSECVCVHTFIAICWTKSGCVWVEVSRSPVCTTEMHVYVLVLSDTNIFIMFFLDFYNMPFVSSLLCSASISACQ